MGWKGNIRSFNAAVKRAEKYQRQVEKQNHLEHCRSLVAKYNFYQKEMVSFHKTCSPSINWDEMRSRIEPITPVRKYEKSIEAKVHFKFYEPNFLIKFLKLEKWMTKFLMLKIVNARKSDKKKFDNEYEIFKSAHVKWDQEKKLADRIYAHEIEAYEEVVLRENTFNKMGNIGASVDLSIIANILEVNVKVNDEDIFSKNSYTLLKSGNLSEKEIPKTQFYNTYQDHVCSVVLRLARELTTIFPHDEVLVTASCDFLNPNTGHIEEQVILSAQIPKATLVRLNMNSVDPSDAMKNFRHNMNFKNGVGFGPVEKIKRIGKSDAA